MKIRIVDNDHEHVIDVLDIDKFDLDDDMDIESLKDEFINIVTGYIEDEF
jgi:hypothetical protein